MHDRNLKRVAAISLIIILSGQCLYQLGLFTYFKLNREYIAEVLCVNKEKPLTMCYGQCFLDKHSPVDEGADQEGLPVEKNKKIEVLLFLVSHATITVDRAEERLVSYDFEEQQKYDYLSLANIFQPPERSVHSLNTFIKI